mmetsp:Transcript_24680/g.68139  ORF Transcript_24680/g.68139 Transcript_24680/m.68139 type:complete len:230 (-) Transcript_24680:2860-3549(-)
MVNEGNAIGGVTLTPEVFTLMAAHATSHPTLAVHGVLIGSRNGSEVNVSDAFPICHETPTKPLVEISISLVQSILEGKDNEKDVIVGWYTAPELLHETKPGPVALRIVANLAAGLGSDDGQGGEPVLLVLNNQSIVDLFADGVEKDKENIATASGTINAFGKDFGMQWMEPIKNLSVTNDSGAVAAAKEALNVSGKAITCRDLVDHWNEGAASEWTKASSLSSFTDKYT